MHTTDTARPQTSTQARERLWDLVKDIRCAMFTINLGEHGELRMG